MLGLASTVTRLAVDHGDTESPAGTAVLNLLSPLCQRTWQVAEDAFSHGAWEKTLRLTSLVCYKKSKLPYTLISATM
jgi:hypothetical protein